MIPPLPPQLVTTILAHLLPPAPPLPASLLARPLLDRLKFLPPSEDDTDAWLSPAPSSSGALTSALDALSIGHQAETPQYAHDGEQLVARLSLAPLVPPTPSADPLPSGVDIMFSFEDTDQSRGWVYHSAQLSHSTDKEDALSWSSSPANPITPPAEDAEQSVEDYWKGFTPPTPTADLPQISTEDEEDAYWASYGGQSGSATPARNKSSANLQRLSAQNPVDSPPERSENDEEMETGEEEMNGSGRVMLDLPTTQGMMDPLAALLSTIPDSMNDERPVSPSREASDLRDKMKGRIQAGLRDVWAGFTRGTEARPESLEEKALGWLRIARSVVDDKSTFQAGTAFNNDLGEIVVRAKMEVLRDLYITVREGDEMDGFWRYVEGAIKMPMIPGGGDEGHTQETYWE